MIKLSGVFSIACLLIGFSGLAFAEEPASQSPPPVIIVDPGHGGKDPGAISRFGIREKDLVLSLSRRLAASLKRTAGARVFFTRSKDRFISLDDRDRIANRHQCDLFISLHANSLANPKVEGVEIYYLNKATDAASRRLAERENAGAPKSQKALEVIVSDLIQTAATEESADLAGRVERRLKRKLQKKYGVDHIRVKTALFYVLVGAKCPSLLIEAGFITNPLDAKRLKKASYQKDFADAIAEVVRQYFRDADSLKGDL